MAWFSRAASDGAASGVPDSVVPMVMAFGLKSGADDSAHTSPLRGSITAVPASL